MKVETFCIGWEWGAMLSAYDSFLLDGDVACFGKAQQPTCLKHDGVLRVGREARSRIDASAKGDPGTM